MAGPDLTLRRHGMLCGAINIVLHNNILIKESYYVLGNGIR